MHAVFPSFHSFLFFPFLVNYFPSHCLFKNLLLLFFTENSSQTHSRDKVKSKANQCDFQELTHRNFRTAPQLTTATASFASFHRKTPLTIRGNQKLESIGQTKQISGNSSAENVGSCLPSLHSPNRSLSTQPVDIPTIKEYEFGFDAASLDRTIKLLAGNATEQISGFHDDFVTFMGETPNQLDTLAMGKESTEKSTLKQVEGQDHSAQSPLSKGRSVCDYDGSLFLGSGLGIPRPQSISSSDLLLKSSASASSLELRKQIRSRLRHEKQSKSHGSKA